MIKLTELPTSSTDIPIAGKFINLPEYPITMVGREFYNRCDSTIKRGRMNLPDYDIQSFKYARDGIFNTIKESHIFFDQDYQRIFDLISEHLNVKWYNNTLFILHHRHLFTVDKNALINAFDLIKEGQVIVHLKNTCSFMCDIDGTFKYFDLPNHRDRDMDLCLGVTGSIWDPTEESLIPLGFNQVTNAWYESPILLEVSHNTGSNLLINNYDPDSNILEVMDPWCLVYGTYATKIVDHTKYKVDEYGDDLAFNKSFNIIYSEYRYMLYAGMISDIINSEYLHLLPQEHVEVSYSPTDIDRTNSIITELEMINYMNQDYKLSVEMDENYHPRFMRIHDTIRIECDKVTLWHIMKTMDCDVEFELHAIKPLPITKPFSNVRNKGEYVTLYHEYKMSEISFFNPKERISFID